MNLRNIQRLFEEQVERTPEAVAVVFKGQQLTYRELNIKANKLANYLQKLGVKPEVLVGICVERSLDIVVGLLGILKAGGVYVPLDPAHPLERLNYMISDAQVRVLLTQQGLVSQLPEQGAAKICLDRDWSLIEGESQENPKSAVEVENLAYVIYTSGSTGNPKGVLIEHQAIARHCQNIIAHYQLDKSDRILQFASLGFDVSLEQILPTLIVGAILILSEIKFLTGLDFHLKLLELGLTVVNLPPAYWTQWLQSLNNNHDATPLNQLRLVICGGEAMPTESLKLWQKSPMRSVRLLNAYGPTETTITAMTFEVERGSSFGKIPIGRPLKNRSVYILGDRQQPVPIGVTGELFIGGDGLARGYLNRPDLTQEKFIPNPFGSGRLYKTGDLARYLPDGNIEFLGRIDHQVKIRGFRIELGEIEAVLSQHPQVDAVVVLAREDRPLDRRLVAYLVPNESSSIQNPKSKIQNQLRDFLKQKLPDYMIPSAFVLLEAFPLTPNGKIDRLNLPAPANIRPRLAEDFVPPSTPTEEILATIWGEVLGLEQIGINDNFFELGGNSLLAMSAISRIQEAFSVELPLNYLFTTPTIALVSQEIENLSQDVSQVQFSSQTAGDALPPLVSIPREQPIPLSLAQQSVWELIELNPDNCAYNCSITLRLTRPISVKVLEQSINEIIRRHEILRTTFTVVEERPLQIVAPSLTLPLKIVNLQSLPQLERDVQVQRIFEQQARHNFNLASGPLIETTLLQLTTEESKLIITVQYLIIDGWSIGIFLSELKTIYGAFFMGKPSPLPEPPVQYGDFTLWEQKWLNEDLLQKNLTYWQKKLGNLPIPLTFFPTKQPQQSRKRGYASLYSLELSESLGTAIKAFSLSQQVTNFVIILTTVKILLFKLSGQTEIVVVGTTANRRTPIIEKMIGWFLNDLYLYSHVDNSQTGLTLLKQVQQTLSEAIAHQEFPVQRLFYDVNSLKSVQTVLISMTPPLPWQGEIFELEPISLVDRGELWDEEVYLLELYILPPFEGSQKIKILGYYSTNLLANETIEQFFSGFQKVLQQLVTQPESKISEFVLS